MKLIAVLFVATVALFAQEQVRIMTGPATQQSFIYSGTSLIAVCEAYSVLTTGPRAAARVAISAVSKASAGVVTSVGHGFDLYSRPIVTISGATGTGWASGAATINGTFTATIIDADTFSIPVNTSGNGTLAGAVIFWTTAPRKTMPEWSVYRQAYDGSGLLATKAWLNGTSAMNQKCSEASSTTLNQQ